MALHSGKLLACNLRWHAFTALGHNLWHPCQAYRHASASSTSETVSQAYNYCIQQVQQYDYDNYVWVVQLPKEHRRAMFALRAFNIETALVSDQVKSKEAPIIQVRFQWWREGLAGALKGHAPKHPVLLALQDTAARMKQQEDHNADESGTPQPSTTADSTIRGEAQLQQGRCTHPAHDAPQGTAADKAGATSQGARTGQRTIRQYHLKRIIDTRAADVLDNQPPLSVEGLERYAEGTASQLLYAQLCALGVASREADHAASHLGKAVGITTLLRGTAFHAAQRRSYLPLDLCAKHSVSQEDVYSMQASEGLRDVVLAVASVAKAHLDEARSLTSKLPKSAAAVMLSSLVCDEYLKQLEVCDFDVFSPRLHRRPGQAAHLIHVLRVKWHMMMNTF